MAGWWFLVRATTGNKTHPYFSGWLSSVTQKLAPARATRGATRGSGTGAGAARSSEKAEGAQPVDLRHAAARAAPCVRRANGASLEPCCLSRAGGSR